MTTRRDKKRDAVVKAAMARFNEWRRDRPQDLTLYEPRNGMLPMSKKAAALVRACANYATKEIK